MAKKKLKADWVKTDIPKRVKVKLWAAMKDNPNHRSWQQGIANLSFDEVDDKYVKTTAETYKRLKQELEKMPRQEVDTLPPELRDWIYSLRPELVVNQRQKGSPSANPPGDYEETTHKIRMRKIARAMVKENDLPSPWDLLRQGDIDLEFLPGRYPTPFGTVEVDENKQINVTHRDIGAGVAEPYLVKGLLSHLATSGLPRYAALVGDQGKINNLAAKAEQYSRALLEYLRSITDEVKARSANLNFHEESKPGLTRWYVITVWNDAIQKAGGYTWIDDSWYKPPELATPSDLWQLKCGAYTIGIAKSKETLKKYENWHKKLRAQFSGNRADKDLCIMSEELRAIFQDISQLLQEFSDRERLPGHCDLC